MPWRHAADCACRSCAASRRASARAATSCAPSCRRAASGSTASARTWCSTASAPQRASWRGRSRWGTITHLSRLVHATADATLFAFVFKHRDVCRILHDTIYCVCVCVCECVAQLMTSCMRMIRVVATYRFTRRTSSVLFTTRTRIWSPPTPRTDC